METILDKLRKIAALADRGDAGERDNAQAALEKLCARHGVTLDQLLDDAIEPIEIKARGIEKQLLTHVAMKIVGTHKIPHTPTSKSIKFWVTRAQGIDITEAFEHYRRAWVEHRKDAMTVFVNANRLFPDPKDDDDDEEDEPPMSPEELARMRRLAAQTLYTVPAPFRKALPEKSP